MHHCLFLEKSTDDRNGKKMCWFMTFRTRAPRDSLSSIVKRCSNNSSQLFEQFENCEDIIERETFAQSVDVFSDVYYYWTRKIQEGNGTRQNIWLGSRIFRFAMLRSWVQSKNYCPIAANSIPSNFFVSDKKCFPWIFSTTLHVCDKRNLPRDTDTRKRENYLNLLVQI